MPWSGRFTSAKTEESPKWKSITEARLELKEQIRSSVQSPKQKEDKANQTLGTSETEGDWNKLLSVEAAGTNAKRSSASSALGLGIYTGDDDAIGLSWS